MAVIHFNDRGRSSGFTLVEVLVSMAIVGIVLGAIYSLFISQSRTASVQEQVVTMQQNLRAAIYFMEREVRMAGYNPARVTAGGAGQDIDCNGTDDPSQSDDSATLMTDESEAIGIKNAQAGSLTFSRDLNGDGDSCDSDESITYVLNGAMLEKNSTPIAENIETLLLEYLDSAGNPASTFGAIRQVVLTVVARTDRSDVNYTDSTSYQSQTGAAVAVPSGQEHFRRRLLSVRVECRNLGL